MLKQPPDGRCKWAEREMVTWRKRRRRHSIFCACTMITGAERNCYELRQVAGGYPRRKPDLNRPAAWAMNPLQARWQRCGIICQAKVARVDKRCESIPRQGQYTNVDAYGQSS